MKITATCANCGKSFEHFDNHNRQHCSRECQRQAKRVQTTCPECGKVFWYHVSWPRKYCSRKCSAANNSKINLGIVELPPQFCEQCGTEITKDKRHNRRFCGQECFGKYQSTLVGDLHPNFRPESRVERPCEECGEIFVTKQFEIDKGWGKFCSRSCSSRWRARELGYYPLAPMTGADNPRWKGGYEPYYGPNWRNQRRNVRRRDNYTCQKCGITESELGRQLDVHHIQRFGSFGPERYQEANQSDNLISLCYKCHTWVENNGLG